MGSIFISYRRGDAEGQAGRLFADLVAHFGKSSVFMDVEDIEPGRDFRKVIDQHVSSCAVLLSLVGKGWLSAADHDGNRRLDDPNDFVRLETASALKRDIPVVPVLVQGADMPKPESLPDDLKEFAFRNAIELSHTRWESDVQLLVKAVSHYVEAEERHEPPEGTMVVDGTSVTAHRKDAIETVKEHGTPITQPPVSDKRAVTTTRIALLIMSVVAIAIAAGGFKMYSNMKKDAATKEEAERLVVKNATEAQDRLTTKAAAEKAAAEKTAAEKAAAEKAAAEKAAAEKAAAEKAAAEKAAAEKAAAEKTAAEKEAAKRAAAERAAAERVAAKRVAAERAAVKKASDEKAAAKKAADELAAVKRAIEEERIALARAKSEAAKAAKDSVTAGEGGPNLSGSPAPHKVKKAKKVKIAQAEEAGNSAPEPGNNVAGTEGIKKVKKLKKPLVTNIAFDPPTGTILNNQRVTFSFSYWTTQANGVRIFFLPQDGDRPAQNFGVSGSPLYPTGSGSGKGFFTIRAGNVRVDGVRVKMVDSMQQTVLFERVYPVSFNFRSR